MAEVGVRQFNLSWTVDTFAPVTHTNIRIRKSVKSHNTKIREKIEKCLKFNFHKKRKREREREQEGERYSYSIYIL